MIGRGIEKSQDGWRPSGYSVCVRGQQAPAPEAPPTPEPLPEAPIWQQAWVWDVAKQVVGGLCERCDTPNSAAASHCVNCGDARDGVEEDVVRRRCG